MLLVGLSNKPWHLSSDYVLGVWCDTDDMEHAQLYDLIKPKR